MKIIRLDKAGVRPAVPEQAKHPARGAYWRFAHGEEGRGRTLVFFPLGARDFPSTGPRPPEGQEYKLIPVSDGKFHILGKGQPDGEALVLWDLSPGFRGGATYKVEGSAKVIAEGYEAQGAAGGMGGAPCPVVHVTGPCRLTWRRYGRLYGQPADWRATFDGHTWTVEPDNAGSDAIAAALEA